MKALVCEHFGPPEELIFTEVQTPDPGEGEILIQAEFCGVNFPDSLIVQNEYQIKPNLPFSPGGELAGKVAKIGPGVQGFALGDRVAGLTLFGAFAEYVVVSAAKTTHVPDSMDLATASAFTLAYGTSYHALVQRAQLQKNDKILVLGAAGGVGLAAVEIAKALGAHVIGAASSAEKLALAQAHGADELVNYATQDLKSAVKSLTGGKGVDVVYDPVGDSLADPAFRSIAWGGRYLVIGFAGGKIPSIPLNLPLLKGASIVGVFWGDFVDRSPEVHKQNMAELYAMHAAGKLKPLLSERFALAKGGEALRWMMQRKAVGKVVLSTSESLA
jgi:NADPH2:quinone reductase